MLACYSMYYYMSISIVLIYRFGIVSLWGTRRSSVSSVGPTDYISTERSEYTSDKAVDRSNHHYDKDPTQHIHISSSVK